MAGEKWDQARAAVGYILDNLNPEDRFNVIVFSTGNRIYANTLQPPAEAEGATRWVNGLEAIGGTDINGALLRALEMVDPERATVLLFVTDGLPTEGETAIDRILQNVRDKAPANVRLFSFGVGDDVDAFLLDRLAQDNRGTSAYVRSGERIDEEVGALYAKVNAPVLTDIELDFGDMLIEDMYPAEPLPDLFAGTQLVIVGRYRSSGEDVTVRLSGDVNGERQTFVYEGLDFPDRAGGGSGTDAEAFIPRLWATRRIGALLDQIRLQGENKELVDSVIRLSIRYGIITPYTSFLIQEDDIFTQTGREVILEEAQSSLNRAFGQSAGAAAVDAAEAISGARGAAAPAAMPTAVQTKSGELIDTREAIRQVRDRAFVLRDGVWIDTAYDPEQMTTQKVEFLSDAYFDLLAQQPALADFFALGERVIVVLEGVAYEVVTA